MPDSSNIARDTAKENEMTQPNSPITISIDHTGDYDSLTHEFCIAVESDDGAIDEGWTVRQEIPESGLADCDFDIETFWFDADTGEEYPASPTDQDLRDEIERITEGTCRTAAASLIDFSEFA